MGFREVEQGASEAALRTLTQVCGWTLGAFAFLCLIARWNEGLDGKLPLLADASLTLSMVVLSFRSLRGNLSWPEFTAFAVAIVSACFVGANSAVGQFAAQVLTGIFMLTLAIRMTVLPALIAGVAGSAVVAILRWSWASVSMTDAAHMVVFQTAMLTAAVVVLNSLFRSIRTSEALALEARMIARRTEILDAEYSHREVIRRVLHDDVLGALRSIIERFNSPHVITTADAIRACEGAISGIREAGLTQAASPKAGDSDSPQTAKGIAEGIISGSRIPVSKVMVLEGPGPDPAASAAMVNASLEAIRNVERHSRASQAELIVDFSQTRPSITIRDRGVGFDVDATSIGVGIRSSIVSRIEEIGGRAILKTELGWGTEWTLVGPNSGSARSAERQGPAQSTLLFERRRIAWGVALPMLCANLWVTLFHLNEGLSIETQRVIAVLMTTSALLAAAAASRAHIARSVMYSFGVVQALLLAIHMYGAGIGAASDFRSWGSGLGAIPLVVLAFFASSLMTLAALSLPYCLVLLLVVAVDPSASFGSSLGFMVSSVAILVSWILGSKLRRTWVEIENQSLALDAERAAESRRGVLESLKGQYLENATRIVLPFLEHLVARPARTTCPGVLARAEVLGATVRDDLYAPGVISATLRAEVDTFRAKGGVLDIRVGVPAEAGKGLPGSVLRELIGDDAGLERVILARQASGKGLTVRMTALPGLPESYLENLRDAHKVGLKILASDEFATTILVTLPETGDGALVSSQL